MTGLIVVFFIWILLVVAAAIVLGTLWIESQKKKKVSQMLQRSGPDAVQIETNVLMEPEKQVSAFLVNWVGRFNVVKQLEAQIQQAGMTMSVYSLLTLMLILAAAGAVVISRVNPLMQTWLSALCGAAALGIAPVIWVRRARSKRMDAFEEQFPEALDFLARAMRAGHAFSISLEMLSEESPQPLGQEFRKVFNEHSLGLPVETALMNLTQRVPLLDVSFFVSAVLLQRETGGNLSEILTKLAILIRERFKLKGQVRACSAHGRITGTVLTLMPVALALGLMTVAPTYLKEMVADPDGRKMILGCVIGMLLGHFSIRRIVDIKV
jgi:tight adherence protein B